MDRIQSRLPPSLPYLDMDPATDETIFALNLESQYPPVCVPNVQEHMHREMISPVEQMRAKYKKRRKEAGTREDSTMAKLAAFTSTIRTTKKRAKKEEKVEEKVQYCTTAALTLL